MTGRVGLPSGRRCFPLAVVVAVVFPAQQLMDSLPAVVLALSSACAVGLAVNWKTMEHRSQAVRGGVESGLISLCTAASVMGFSSVVQLSPAFPGIIEGIMAMGINPYVKEFVGINILSGIVGSPPPA